MVCCFQQHDLQVRSMCRKRLVHDRGMALTLGRFFFLVQTVKRSDSMDVPCSWPRCVINKGCCRLHQIRLRHAHFHGALFWEIFSEQGV